VLSTTLSVEMVDQQVPVWEQKEDKTWQCCMEAMKLRSYVASDPQCRHHYDKYKRWVPGPTLHVRKPADKAGRGDAIRVLLVNETLGPDSGHACNPCDCTLSPKPKCCSQCDCTQSPQPECCGPKGFRDTYPDCFHGDNTTNLHFHGTHVSPQSPQDYVLLELAPGSGPVHGAAPGRGTMARGRFQYSVDPLRWTQPEGTHWYHPHKHGSTALQVAGGMAGDLIVRGPFDDWLSGIYDQKGQTLREKILIIQQLHVDNNFGVPGAETPPQPLINGQASPRIKMFPGEVQRWRLTSATMEGAAQLAIDFDGPFGGPVEAVQIAMDGIQLSRASYEQQELLPQNVKEIVVSPGNRVDVLVKAPARPGKYFVTYEVVGAVESEKKLEGVEAVQRLRAAPRPKSALAAVPSEPTLLTLEVVAPCPTCTAMAFPPAAQWPLRPEYLPDIPPAQPTRDLWFRLADAAGKDVGPARQPSKFFINFQRDGQQQYRTDCVPITVKLGDSEEWKILNTSRRVRGTTANPFHVFHIHTNPFQVTETWGLKEVKDNVDVCEKVVLDPPIWHDAITLPSACTVDGVVQPGYVKIRQRFEEFTGEFVLHCHFLGHEDRGMMLGVQIVCPEKPDSFGRPRSDGPECAPGNYIAAAPRCAAPGG
jgi:FtsP/CotA-like multicopper oxidase with cupredoxin domain